jgi:cytoskeletal protein CcmA (bactofilin family)
MSKSSQEYADLIINGVGDAAAGRYHRVDINGVGKMQGDIIAKTFKMNGILRSQGSIIGEQLDLNGMISVKGDLKADTIVIEGEVKVGGSIAGERMKLNGLLTAQGDCDIESFDGKCGFTIGGLLNVGTMNLQLFGRCQAREIGGETIRVRKTSRSSWSKLRGLIIPKYSPELKVSVIEGDQIELEETTAAVVRGKHVFIGRGCIIEKVEYSGTLTVLPGAKVGEELKVNGN